MTTQDQLLDAIEKNDIPTVSSLIASGFLDLDDEFPLHHAAFLGHVGVMSLLLDAGADINAVDDERNTSAHLATFNSHFPALKLLVERGADLTVVNADGDSLLSAASTARIDVVQQLVIFLLDAGAPLDQLEDYVVLHVVQSAAIFERFSARNIDLNALRNADGATLCHYVARNVTREDDLYFLIDACDNDAVNSVDRRGMTPLHWAATNTNASAMRALVELGAEIDRPNVGHDDGWTALHMLCSASGTNLHCVELLLVLGANVSLVTRSGETACHIAARFRSGALCACLAAGGNLDQPNDRSDTARMIATRNELVLPTVDEIDAARRRLSKARLDLVRHRALQICLGLQSLNVTTLELYEIMSLSFGALGSLIAFHQWWTIATKVKHFHNNKQ